jgi:D-amino-acid dehydrogenase
MTGTDPAIRIRPGLDFDFFRWGLTFLGQCTTRNFSSNTIEVLKLALQSASLMESLREEVDFDFSFRKAGKLVLIRGFAELDAAKKSTTLKNQHGCDVRILNVQEAFEIEPSLQNMRTGYSGAVYSAGDHVGDAKAFSVGLAKFLQSRFGVDFRLGCEAHGVQIANGRISGVLVGDDSLPADAVVVCLGAWSSRFLGNGPVSQRIVPVRGYSITLPPGKHPPRLSISDVEHRIVFSSLNDTIRIAGFADFLGFDDQADAGRIELLLKVARSVAPDAADYTAIDQHGWGGFRPMTANSRPIVGPGAVRGLYLNYGHGMLGWTLACSTGFNVAQMLAT